MDSPTLADNVPSISESSSSTIITTSTFNAAVSRFDHVCLPFARDGKCTNRHPKHTRTTHIAANNWSAINEMNICLAYHHSLDAATKMCCEASTELDNVNNIVYCEHGSHYKLTINRESKELFLINPYNNNELLDTIPLQQ